jgi:7,8-dihydropterin-6-yl-methyl-4-(beta-D-ribofuranosyl)aminobenzene 5'-phosphate synthase
VTSREYQRAQNHIVILGCMSGRGEGPVLQEDDLATYRKLAHREDPLGILQARNLRSKVSHL